MSKVFKRLMDTSTEINIFAIK